MLETAGEGMVEGGGSGRTESVGGSDAEGSFLVGGLVVELEEWLVESETGLVEGVIMAGRPAMEAYTDDAWR